MTRSKTNPDFLNGIPELLVLQLISGKPMYGYQIVQELAKRESNVFNFSEGCIYPTLHQLERKKYLLSKKELIQGRNRIVYSITKKGEGRLEESSNRFYDVIQSVHSILNQGHGKPAFH